MIAPLIRSYREKPVDNRWFWWANIFVIKSIIALFFLVNSGWFGGEDALLGKCIGDCQYYVGAFENLTNNGTYAIYDNDQGEPIPHTGRMPGYEVAFLLFSFLDSTEQVLNAVFLLQFCLSAIAIYYLSLIAYYTFDKSRSVFVVTLLLSSLSTYVALFDFTVYAESLGLSTFIFSVYNLIKPKDDGQWDYVWCGLWLTWAIFLRQYYAPFLLLFVVFLVLKEGGFKLVNRSRLLKKTFLLLLPFILVDGLWVIRNYQHKRKLIPFVDDIFAGYVLTEETRALFNLIQTWGFDMVNWNPKAEITFFSVNPVLGSNGSNYQSPEALPDYIYSSGFTPDSALYIREKIALLKSPNLSEASYRDEQHALVTYMNRVASEFREEQPFYYWLYGPVRLMVKFVGHSGTYNLFDKPYGELDWFRQIMKWAYSFLYLTILLLGYLWILKDLRGATLERLLLYSIPFYILFLCPLVLRRIEYRYFIMAYPFLLIYSVVFSNKIMSYFGGVLKSKTISIEESEG